MFGRIPSVFGANHGGELSLGPAGYVLIKGMDDTCWEWYMAEGGEVGVVLRHERVKVV